MPFLLAEILNFQGSPHLIGVGSLSNISCIEIQFPYREIQTKVKTNSNISCIEILYRVIHNIHFPMTNSNISCIEIYVKKRKGLSEDD